MIYRLNNISKYSIIGLIGVSILFACLYYTYRHHPVSTLAERTSFAHLPLTFEPNIGQVGAGAEFLSRGQGYSLLLNPASVIFSLFTSTNKDATANPQRSTLGMYFVDANSNAIGSGKEQLIGRSHYYIGDDPSDWHADIPLYKKVEYRQVYPGIDVIYYGRDQRMEFDFVLASDADPQQIRIVFDGATGMYVDDAGDLVFGNDQRGLVLKRPVAYQHIDGQKEIVAAAFELLDSHTVGFSLADYNAKLPLIIDPVITYSSYLGGDGNDSSLAITVDSSGNRYITGSTNSDNFPSVSNTKASGLDAFVVKLDASGSNLVYATYLGGGGDDIANGIAVDTIGNVYIAGNTNSGSLPNQTVLQPNHGGGQDGFVAKINDLGQIIYSSYLGGSDFDNANAIAIDAVDPPAIYVAGTTVSGDFPLSSCTTPLQCTHASPGVGDGFVVKINNDGDAILYSSYLGGSGIDRVAAIAVDNNGQAYLTGDTSSSDFPVTFNAVQSTYGGDAADAFVTILAANGSRAYSTYLGAGSWDRGLDIAIDDSGNAYVTGFTSSATAFTGGGNFLAGFPITLDAYQPFNAGGDFDAFFSKINPQAATAGLSYSTYLGGDNRDQAAAIALNDQQQVFIVGTTGVNSGAFGSLNRSNDFPLKNAFQFQGSGDSDGFITQFDTDGTLLFSSYLGGNGDDSITSIDVDDAGLAHLAGISSSADIAIVGPLQGNKAGSEDGFVVDIDTSEVNLPDIAVSVSVDPTPIPEDDDLIYTLEVINNGPADASGISVVNSVENATIKTASPLQGSCNLLGTTNVNCNIGSLVSGASTTVTVTTKPVSIGNASSTIILLRANQSDTVLTNNSDTVSILVVDNSGSSSAGSLSYVLFILTLIGLALRRNF